jgi:predicted esterase
VIFLHGLGDTGYGWLQIIEILHKKTPHIKYILPTAPSRAVTINGGESMPAWYVCNCLALLICRYDIKSLSEKSRSDPLDGLDDTEKISMSITLLFLTYFLVTDLIEEEIGNGTPSHKIMLGGFSQGKLFQR